MPTTRTNVLKSPCVSNEMGSRLLQGLSRRDKQACDGHSWGNQGGRSFGAQESDPGLCIQINSGQRGPLFFSALTLGGSRSACQCGRNQVRCLNLGFTPDTERARPCQVERRPATLGPPYPSGWEAPRLGRVGHWPSALSFGPPSLLLLKSAFYPVAWKSIAEA